MYMHEKILQIHHKIFILFLQGVIKTFQGSIIEIAFSFSPLYLCFLKIINIRLKYKKLIA